MKTIGKAICCILSAALFLYLMVWDYPQYKAKLNSESLLKTGFEGLVINEGGDIVSSDDDKSGSASDSESGDLKKQVETLEKQIKELENQKASAGCQVNLYFDQVYESAYEQLYPMMTEKGLTGTLVLTDGQLPGDNLQMTESQCIEMLDNGWSLAVGGSEDIDMTGDLQSVTEQWREYLKGYMTAIVTRLNVVPDTYCFNEGEYREEFDEILKEFGFKTIRYFGDEQLEGEDNGLTRIRGYRVSQDTETADVLKNISGYSSVALTTRRVTDEIQGNSQNIEIGKYENLLKSIENADGLYISGSAGEQEYKEMMKTLEAQIEKLKAQKEEIEKQMDEE